MEKQLIYFGLFLSISSTLLSQSELAQKRELLNQKQNQGFYIEQKIIIVRADYNNANESLSAIEKKQKETRFNYENKKNAFDRASKNIDLVSNDKLSQLSHEFKLADEELRQINTEFQQAELKEQEALKKLSQTNSEKRQIEDDIASLNEDIFDIQLREPVWAIGEAVCNLAENESPDQCRKRALESAQRDAMEKAGKMILESETIVRNYQIYLDEIRTHLQAQIIDQDNNLPYGVRREVIGDNIRYYAKIRIKVQSIISYNPYRKISILPLHNNDILSTSYDLEQPPPDDVPFDKEPVVIKKIEPAYPELTRKAGLEGMVKVKMWVDKQGKVKDAVILKSSSELFNQPAIDAAKQWIFTPALIHDKPVSVWVSMDFNFKLY